MPNLIDALYHVRNELLKMLLISRNFNFSQKNMIYLYEKSQVKKYLDFFSFKPGMHNTRPAACQMWSAKALYPARKAQNHVYLACFFQKKHPLICKNV
jgi:hypothetical protein